MGKIFKIFLFSMIFAFHLLVGLCQVHAVVADFSAEPTTGTLPLTVNFTDQSTGAITSWEWAFGDDNATSTEQNPSHIYNEPGSYTVSLTVDGSEGSDSETKTDYITANADVGALNVTLSPQGAIDGGAQWNVGGGAWQDSGATVSGLEPGEHTINYKAVTGWSPPFSEILTIIANETREITRSYVEQPVNIFCVSNAAELQSALTTAASNGADDLIRIVQGTYNGNFVYSSEESDNLTVEGGYIGSCVSREVDPANTILDGNRLDMVLALVCYDGAADFSIDGLTLQNGKTSTLNSGGALYAETGGNGSFTNNTFASNLASVSGGGLYFSGVGATLINNKFIQNEVTTHGGGGGAAIRSHGPCEITIEDNTFAGNIATYHGGGFWVASSASSEVNFSRNTFTENSAAFGGGASFSFFSIGEGSVIMTDNLFTKNTTIASDSGDGGGGGVFIRDWYETLTVIISNNIFTNNKATNCPGGGLFVNSTNDLKLTNNRFIDNAASRRGGGAYVPGKNTILRGNEFVRNTAMDGGVGDGGGGVYGGGLLTNNTFNGNRANMGGGVHLAHGAVLSNNKFTKNLADEIGGGAYVIGEYCDEATFVNNTFTNNEASEAGGIYLKLFDDSCSGHLYNNIFWDNKANIASDLYIKNKSNIPFVPVPVALFNNDFDQSQSGTYIEMGAYRIDQI